MAWTSPRRWTVGEMATAALLNTHLRDNLLVTEVKAITTAGDLVKGSGANALTRIPIGTANQHKRVSSGVVPTWTTPLNAVGRLAYVAGVSPAGGNNLNTNWNAAPGDPETGRIYAAHSGPDGALNDEASWYLLLEAGTYSFFMIYHSFSGAGIVSIRLNGTEFGTQDMYSASEVKNATKTVTGIAVAPISRHSLTLKITSKHASSSGYGARIARLCLSRTGA